MLAILSASLSETLGTGILTFGWPASTRSWP